MKASTAGSADHPILLIHLPTAKPSEPAAGIARAEALRAHCARYQVIEANLEGLLWLLKKPQSADNTWSRRALRHRDRHLEAIRSPET